MSLQLMKLFHTKSYWGCNFHTSPCITANPGKAFRKIMGNVKPKKRMYNGAPTLPTASSFSKGVNEGKYSGNSRRSAVLNKMFMRHITDLMATGENSSEFLGHGIEINYVQITPDFNGVNVFWISKGNHKDEVIDEILRKNAGYLRHELSSLKVMGVVPKIYFVKDKRNAILGDIDARLAIADYGEDHVPLELGVKLKTQLELLAPLDPEQREKIESFDKEMGEEVEQPLPAMPQDVLGLNHAEILNRIRKTMKKSEAKHREIVDSPNSVPLHENPIELETLRQQRIAFKEFLHKQTLARSKAHKENKNYYPDLEYLKEELESHQLEHFKNLDIYDTYDDNDYVEEEDELNNKK